MNRTVLMHTLIKISQNWEFMIKINLKRVQLLYLLKFKLNIPLTNSWF